MTDWGIAHSAWYLIPIALILYIRFKEYRRGHVALAWREFWLAVFVGLLMWSQIDIRRAHDGWEQALEGWDKAAQLAEECMMGHHAYQWRAYHPPSTEEDDDTIQD